MMNVKKIDLTPSLLMTSEDVTPEAFNLFACSGILFNHESPRRGFEFVN